jgi:hypothetical protein
MKRLPNCLKDSPADLALGLVAAAALAWFICNSLQWTAFWFDESVQFYISRGLCSFGPPGQEPGGVRHVLKQNARDNLDPGGFSLLLHFWLLCGAGMAWQRALPLLFFLGGVAGLGWLGWRWRRDVRFAVFSALVSAAYPMLMNYANEVRAYSMEFAGVVCGCLVLDLLLEDPRPRRCLIGGAMIGVFLSSRYSYVIFAVAVSVVFFLQLLADRAIPLPARAKVALRFFAPLACIGIVILLKGFWPQYKLRISYNNGEMLGYLAPYMASGTSVSQILQTLGTNLFSLSALPLTVIPMAALALGRRVSPFYLLPLLTLAITALLWKWHPWNMGAKWSSYLHALSAVMIVRLSADVLGTLETSPAWFRIRPRLAGPLLAVVICALSTLAIVHRRPQSNNLVPILQYLEGAQLEERQVAVNIHWYPTLRYFCEEGVFDGRLNYPRAFCCLPLTGGQESLIAEKTRYLITYQKLEQLADLYPGAKFVADPELPANLYRVQTPNPASSDAYACEVPSSAKDAPNLPRRIRAEHLNR